MVVWAGVQERGREGVGQLGMLAIGCVVLLVLLSLAETRGSDVSASDFWSGLAGGTVAIALIPAAAYYALGRGLGHRTRLLMVVWLVSQALLVAYLFLTFLWTIELTHCGPDAYECPF